jgi:hypothetical protein
VRLAALALALAALAPACAGPKREIPLFARAQLAPDFGTYVIQRVGVLPLRTPARQGTRRDDGTHLQQWFATQIALGTSYEVVALTPALLEDLRLVNPRVAGHHDATALLALTQRFSLDAILFVEIVDQHPYPPQSVTAQAELVACETGTTVWSASINLDARDPRVQEGLEVYSARDTESVEAAARTDVTLLSPRGFAEFALWQIAQML